MQDLPRTFPGHPWLDTPQGHAALRRVLVGYSFRDSDVGYCQVNFHSHVSFQNNHTFIVIKLSQASHLINILSFVYSQLQRLILFHKCGIFVVVLCFVSAILFFLSTRHVLPIFLVIGNVFLDPLYFSKVVNHYCYFRDNDYASSLDNH